MKREDALYRQQFDVEINANFRQYRTAGHGKEGTSNGAGTQNKGPPVGLLPSPQYSTVQFRESVSEVSPEFY